ncbi:MAG: NAD-dependent epimerase/dehydratase family protein, partial [Bacteroidales bacterium]
VVYVVIGFPYKTKVWKKVWPPFVQSVIDSCKKYGSRLVFFDNIYMYDPDHLKGMTEETPFKPVSKKGEIRKEVAEMLLKEMEKGDLNALIARAPDFLSTHNSVITEMVLKNLKKGKKANWPGRLDKIHNYIYTPDAAKATALLGNTLKAFNQTWHLPADPTPFTGIDWVNMAAEITGSKPKVSAMSTGMMNILGIFIPVLGEMKEMNYQYERDYLFDSSKIEKEFKIKPTPAKDALKKVIDKL